MASEIKNEWGNKKIECHPESYKLLVKMSEMYGGKPLRERTIEEARQLVNKIFYDNETPDFDGTIEDRRVPSEEVKDGILVRIYKPSNIPETPKVLVYFHGGAQMFGDIDGTRTLHRTLSQRCGLIIVDVEYRLCPETKLPGGMDDCVTVTKWVLENKTVIGGTQESPVGVGGDSAGGQTAIYVTHRVKGLDFQILVYPWGDFARRSPSTEEFASMSNPEDRSWLYENVLEKGADIEDPRWSPVYHKVEDCVGLPPALVIQAQVDYIRDDGKRYAKLLIDAGVYTTVVEIKGACHGFFGAAVSQPELNRLAFKHIETFLSGL